MARKRASMREGPLAELFRATEAAQRQADREGVDAAPPADAAVTPTPAPVVPRAPAAPRDQSRWIEPMPEPAPRLNRVSPDAASYLAVIRVVGVGGAGLNALHRMMDAGISAVDFLAVNTDIQQ